MRAGDLNGRGVVYGHDGRLILQPGESVVRIFLDCVASVLPCWGRWSKGYAVIDTYAGKGDWYVTNKRMVFIRKPGSGGVKWWRIHPLELADGVDETLRIRRVRREGGFDYCEIEYNDVRFYKKHRRSGTLLLMTSGIKYQVPIKNGMLEAVLPFLKERGVEQR